jgi:sodium/potassium-transporting ATPase subunit alpha
VDIISQIAILMAIVFFLIGIIVARFQNVLYYFIVGFLIIIVANVPQGMPAAIMSYLSIIAKRLRNKSILIKNLDTIDELGAATVLATSKAGIITQNCLTVTDIWYNQKNLKGISRQFKSHYLSF